MDAEVRVVAVFQAVEERVGDLLALLEELAGPSRAEAGCVEYGFVQDTANPTVILAVERWRDRAAFDAHLETPHFNAAVGKLDGLLTQEPAIHACKTVI